MLHSQAFDAALDESLRHPSWHGWAVNILPRCTYPPDNAAEVAAASVAWGAAMVAKKARFEEEQRQAQLQEQQQAQLQKQQQSQGGNACGNEGGSGLQAWAQEHRTGLAGAALAAVGVITWLLVKAWKSRPPVL